MVSQGTAGILTVPGQAGHQFSGSRESHLSIPFVTSTSVSVCACISYLVEYLAELTAIHLPALLSWRHARMIASVPVGNMSKFLVRSVDAVNVTEDIDQCGGLLGAVRTQTPPSPLSPTYCIPLVP